MEVRYWRCWGCYKEYENRDEVSGSLQLLDGEDTITFSWLCRTCVKEIAGHLRRNYVGAKKEKEEVKKICSN